MFSRGTLACRSVLSRVLVPSRAVTLKTPRLVLQPAVLIRTRLRHAGVSRRIRPKLLEGTYYHRAARLRPSSRHPLP